MPVVSISLLSIKLSTISFLFPQAKEIDDPWRVRESVVLGRHITKILLPFFWYFPFDLYQIRCLWIKSVFERGRKKKNY